MIVPIPKLKRKLRIQIKADEWAGGDVDEVVDLPKRVWSGRNTGVMFKVLFVDAGNEFAKYEQVGAEPVGREERAGDHKLG
jgi:hypothetical protein